MKQEAGPDGPASFFVGCERMTAGLVEMIVQRVVNNEMIERIPLENNPNPNLLPIRDYSLGLY